MTLIDSLNVPAGQAVRRVHPLVVKRVPHLLVLKQSDDPPTLSTAATLGPSTVRLEFEVEYLFLLEYALSHKLLPEQCAQFQKGDDRR